MTEKNIYFFSTLSMFINEETKSLTLVLSSNFIKFAGWYLTVFQIFPLLLWYFLLSALFLVDKDWFVLVYTSYVMFIVLTSVFFSNPDTLIFSVYIKLLYSVLFSKQKRYIAALFIYISSVTWLISCLFIFSEPASYSGISLSI